jgi:hypothetical protein
MVSQRSDDREQKTEGRRPLTRLHAAVASFGDRLHPHRERGEVLGLAFG